MKRINFTNPDWAYLLGVIHGDGHISKRTIEISVGHNASFYADTLIALITELGFSSCLYDKKSCIRIDINSQKLANDFRKFKNNGIWSIPVNINKPHYLAGIIDTDGCVSNVFSKQKKMAVIISLKKSGNLLKVGELLTDIGFRDIHVNYRNAKYKNAEYPIETIALTGEDRMRLFYKKIQLRHKLKKDKMETIIQDYDANKSLSRIIAEQLKITPLSIPEIMTKYNLNKRQADSILQNLRNQYKIQTIPPIPSYTTYKIL